MNGDEKGISLMILDNRGVERYLCEGDRYVWVLPREKEGFEYHRCSWYVHAPLETELLGKNLPSNAFSLEEIAKPGWFLSGTQNNRLYVQPGTKE